MVTEKALRARMQTVSKTARPGLALALLAALSGCTSTMYLLQAADGEWHVMHARQPIVQVIDDPRTPETLIRELADVRAARNFASRVLKLPNNDSYRTYVKIDRPYVVWNVVAAPALSVRAEAMVLPHRRLCRLSGLFQRAARARLRGGIATPRL